ncbi:TetR/AcrR family transcriptional regulator [Actinomadura roseirufa]|uniref:TetR/AcrR family transcriptional regulator n=1 Tax=Actinomadura roseirufa TaxID=2094049 RepID=UPI001A9550FD|nr:TetR/AcrR family transcriptional regulator [Actinomadura roseirufa]
MTSRMSAAERREMVIEAAVAEFAVGGYEGTSTAVIAERVGVSQPYLFRLFPSKRALFLAAAERCFDEIEAALREAAGGLYGEEAVAAMAATYRRVLADRPALLRFQLQIYAAAVGDEDVARLGHRKWARLWRELAQWTGAEPADIMRFVAGGMLVNVLTAFKVPFGMGQALPGSLDEWAKGLRWSDDGTPFDPKGGDV